MIIFTAALHRFRWLHTPLGVLMVLMQRTPVLRIMTSAGEASSGLCSNLLLRSAFAATAMGACNSLAGASARALSPAIGKAPVAPAKGVLEAGSPLSLSVTPKSALFVNYQWRLNNSPIYGANSNTFEVASVGNADAGSYTVTLSNLYGSVTSKPVVITVYDAPATLPAGGTLTGTVNWSDSLAGASSEVLTLEFAAKTITDSNDPAGNTAYTYKRVNPSTGVITATTVWTGTGKQTETTKKTYTLVFGTYHAAARAWPVDLTVSGSYSGKDAAGKAYKGTITGSGAMTFVKP